MLSDRRSDYKLQLVECTPRRDISALSDKLKLIGPASLTFEFSTAVVMRFAKTKSAVMITAE